MHALFGLSSLLLIALIGYLILGLLRRTDVSARRRHLQLIVLAAPLASLGVGLGGLRHFLGRTCFLGTPSWDYLAGVVLPSAMGSIAVAGLIFGVVRLTVMSAVAARRGAPAGRDVQGIVDRLAERMKSRRPRVFLCASDRPLAFTCGIWRPALFLSTWMIDHLDRHEVESVIAHELGHVARRDYLVVWVATVLRDAVFYLPTSWAACGQLLREKEPACDDLAVTVTRRPLALASALAKVWQQALDGPAFNAAQPLVESARSIEQRIERLLGGLEPRTDGAREQTMITGAGMQAAVGIVTLMAANVAVMLMPMGCGLGSLLGTG
ncbi:MAG: M56 family metallopeptidase [Armatimonadota bacterium]